MYKLWHLKQISELKQGRKIEGGLQDNDVSMITKWAKQSQNRTLMMRIWVTEAREKKRN